MHARAIEEAAARLARQRGRTIQGAALSTLSAAAAGGLAALGSDLFLAFATASALAGLVALHSEVGRRGLVGRLALDADAYAIPEVRRFGSRVARPEERARLARWIEAIVLDPERPGTFHLPDRVRRHASDLQCLARELLAPGVRVQPVSAVACRRLLTHAVESPLYNPNLPPEDLTAALYRIRQGFLGPQE